MTNNRRPRPAGEIQNRFNAQMDYLYRSCRAFDAGQENEAARIALTLRVLLHHKLNKEGKGSHALLVQLNLLDTMPFIDSGVRRDLLRQANEKHFSKDGMSVASEPPSDTGLVLAGFVDGKGKFLAPLVRNRYRPEDYKHQCIVTTRPFQDWWSTAFIETTNGSLFSRSDIILILANQDGGGHVDPEIDADFSDFCQDFYQVEAGPDFENLEPVDTNIVHASVRQIAFEVMTSLDDFQGTDWADRTISGNTIPPRMFIPSVTLFGEDA